MPARKVYKSNGNSKDRTPPKYRHTDELIMPNKPHTLDEILDEYYAPIKLPDNNRSQLIASLIDYIESEIIGEDEETWVDLGEVENAKQDGRNELRTQLRAVLTKERGL